MTPPSPPLLFSAVEVIGDFQMEVLAWGSGVGTAEGIWCRWIRKARRQERKGKRPTESEKQIQRKRVSKILRYT